MLSIVPKFIAAMVVLVGISFLPRAFHVQLAAALLVGVPITYYCIRLDWVVRTLTNYMESHDFPENFDFDGTFDNLMKWKNLFLWDSKKITWIYKVTE